VDATTLDPFRSTTASGEFPTEAAAFHSPAGLESILLKLIDFVLLQADECGSADAFASPGGLCYS